MNTPYSIWLGELDKVFIKELGTTYRSFEDYDWYAEFEADVSPRESYDEWNLIAGPAAQ